MDLHPDERVVFEGHPSWRGVLSFYIKGLIGAIVVGVVVWLVFSAGAGIAAFAIVMAGDVVAGYLMRMSTRYAITTERLRIRRGILNKHVQQTRIDRVQNVNTEQSIVDRILRVGRVDFDTAGTDDSDFSFRGVARPAEVVAAVDRAQREARGASRAGDTLGL